ncbi:MAG: ferric iron uptake transcriptional regulator [Gammaproteobacteria bacterium]|nr:ferric iron uptake transcriptional regulator [Gammaproteobacteria bacterium]MCP5201650.1 ferric iron uptake transcriptional regulator [Gammaproteobacteria bacterium]
MDTQELKKAGLKATLPRLRILEILDRSRDRHLSAEDVYKALIDAGEDVGLATIYRVLTQFETAGLVQRHNFDGGHAVFEMAQEEHHDHMVRVDTGEVIEFYDEEIERRQREIVAAHGYDLEDHSLVLYVRPRGDNKAKSGG